ncbi:flagellar hook-length control protein FliK [Comamonas sp. lk]|uniref:flagellar hook-length control protein FliK n=1 Tax=Comamonas sp. lk TaxID=2201272 RepID=UPI000EB50B85|nr:flagellar hook-length control protein FliK [Comamonas sp. lk]
MSDTRIEHRLAQQTMATSRSAGASTEQGVASGFSSVLAAQGAGAAGFSLAPAEPSGVSLGLAANLAPLKSVAADEDLAPVPSAEALMLAGQVHAPWMSLVGQTAAQDSQADTDLRQGVATDFLSGRGHAGLLAQRQSLASQVGGANATAHAAFLAVDSKQNLPQAQYLNAQAAINVDASTADLADAAADASGSKNQAVLAADALQSAVQQTTEVRHTAQHGGSLGLQGMTAVQPQELTGLKESLLAAMQRGKGAEDLADSAGNRPAAQGGHDALATAVAAGALQAGMQAGTQAGGQNASAFAQTADGQAAPAEREQEISEQVAFWAHQKNHHAALSIQHEGKPIQVQVQLNGQEAHVRFAADDEQARQLLADGQSQLRELLQAQGLQLAGVSVGSGKADSQGNSQRDQRDEGRSSARQARVQLTADVGGTSVAASPKSAGVDVFV